MGLSNPHLPDGINNVFQAGIRNMRVSNLERLRIWPEEKYFPLCVCVVGLASVVTGDIDVKPSIWRYVFSVDGKKMLADIDEESDGSLSFNSVFEGKEIEMYGDVLREAENVASRGEEDFCLQILEIPGMSEIVIWLKGKDKNLIMELISRVDFRILSHCHSNFIWRRCDWLLHKAASVLKG